MASQKLSLIVTVYNKAPFLRRCLDSVKKQMRDDVQVIVVDDASTDGSADIELEYLGVFKIWQNDKNGGVSAARNWGIHLADGEGIAFLDADDALEDGALDMMVAYVEHLEKWPIIQYGQKRFMSDGRVIEASSPKGGYWRYSLPKYWQMVWNKVYSKKFIVEHSVRFREDMFFGEDEMFNIDLLDHCEKIFHSPHILVQHWLDDRNSICRGGSVDCRACQKLDKVVDEKIEACGDKEYRRWLLRRREALRRSKMFVDAGFVMAGGGEHDIVYMLREGKNEELRYSLRSVEENMPYKRVWFAGGKPDGLTPDRYMPIKQDAPSKWENVRNMLVEVCKNDDITEDFWLFNDDFFILKPYEGDTQWVNGTLKKQIARVERRGGVNNYTNRLRHLVDTLESDGLPTKNYSVHKPMLVNRKKALEVLEKYPDEPMFRALYGNYWRIKARDEKDCKIRRSDYAYTSDYLMVSTQDDSFKFGKVGDQLRDRFTKISRFEV